MSELDLPSCPICRAPGSLLRQTQQVQGHDFIWYDCRECDSVLLWIGENQWMYQRVGKQEKEHLLKRPITGDNLRDLLSAADTTETGSAAALVGGEDPGSKAETSQTTAQRRKKASRTLVIAIIAIMVFAVAAMSAMILRPSLLPQQKAALPIAPTRTPAFTVAPTSSTVGGQHLNVTGRIVYVSRNASRDEEIWVMNADGTNPARLTTGELDENPACSPDGTKIVFDSDRNTTNCRRVFVMNADGTGIRPLTSDQWDNGRAAWSPDGRMIVFASQQHDAVYGLYIMDSDGHNITHLFSGHWENYPTWSPDGSKIAFQRWNPHNIYAADLDKGTITALTRMGMDSEPEWSPDGSRIVFVSRREWASGGFEVYVMNSDGSNPVNLSRHPASDTSPTWSPDGTHIAFVSNRDGNLEIYVMNADGTGVARLTRNGVNDYTPDWTQ